MTKRPLEGRNTIMELQTLSHMLEFVAIRAKEIGANELVHSVEDAKRTAAVEMQKFGSFG